MYWRYWNKYIVYIVHRKDWLLVIGVFLRRFQQSFSHITPVAACCMRRNSARGLSATNTDGPWRRHKTWVHQPVTLSWHRANQSWFYTLNAERLARKQPVPMFTPLVWRGRDPNPQPPDYEANALSTWPRSRYIRTWLLVYLQICSIQIGKKYISI